MHPPKVNSPIPRVKVLSREELAQRLKAGASVDDIARETGADPKVVYRRLVELKLKVRL